MLFFHNLCKLCQYCLESMYWNCCEEKFCFDEKIATHKLDEATYSNGYRNMGASLDSVVTEQPNNNNNNFLPQETIVSRDLQLLPLHADKLYEVFSKSMIFNEDILKLSQNSLDELETKSEPDYLSDKPNRTKVYFEDEVNSPVTDFEIMFKDELIYSNDIFKIDEEEEMDKKSFDTEEGLTMSVEIRKQDIVKPSTVTMKDENKITTRSSVYQYDPISVVSLPFALSLPRIESVKGILRQKTDLTRSLSAKTLERVNSQPKLHKSLNRVESLKNIDPTKMNKVLARVPVRSASFLNIPEHLLAEKPPLIKSKSTIGVVSIEDELKVSNLPDTPIIRSNNLPRFFAESPTIPEFKGQTSLQSIKLKSSIKLQENDFSMPRYYGVNVAKSVENLSVHESKSMPDLRISTGKASKRLVKIRSRLKPLVIKKGGDEII